MNAIWLFGAYGCFLVIDTAQTALFPWMPGVTESKPILLAIMRYVGFWPAIGALAIAKIAILRVAAQVPDGILLAGVMGYLAVVWNAYIGVRALRRLFAFDLSGFQWSAHGGDR